MSHKFGLLNDRAMELSAEVFDGTFRETLNRPHHGLTDAGERQFISHGGPFDAWFIGMFLADLPLSRLADLFEKAVEEYPKAGITTFGSRLRHPVYVSGFHQLLRREGKLPARYAYSVELHRGIIPSEARLQFYPRIGAQWETMETGGPWLWQHGVSSEGGGDSVQGACLGPDLEAQSPEQKEEEACFDSDSTSYQVFKNALKSGWRPVATHGVGSHGVRTWIQMIEEAIEESPSLTREQVREMRIGFAHGTMVGTQSDVIEKSKDLNIHIPINVHRAIEDETDVILDRYGEAALDFFAPVKSLLDEGVKVVGESEHFTPDSDWYFEAISAYVNRTIPDSDVWVPEEGVDRVTALKLMTVWAAEFLHAEEFVGSLEPGKLADFIVIDRDILDVSDEALSDNEVVMTVIDGEIVYDTDENQEEESQRRLRTSSEK